MKPLGNLQFMPEPSASYKTINERVHTTTLKGFQCQISELIFSSRMILFLFGYVFLFWWGKLLFIAVLRLLIEVASLVEHGL